MYPRNKAGHRVPLTIVLPRGTTNSILITAANLINGGSFPYTTTAVEVRLLVQINFKWCASEMLSIPWQTTCPSQPYPPYTPGYNSFSDVCYGSAFYQYIETVKVRGAISGYNDTAHCSADNPPPCFLVGNSTTRGQMSKIINESLNSDSIPPPLPACWYQGVQSIGDMSSK